MRVYRQKTEQPIKWIIAALLFCLVLGWSLTDVYGTEIGNDQKSDRNCGAESTVNTPPQQAPSAVPEPTSILLLAAGLGGAVAYRRLKK